MRGLLQWKNAKTRWTTKPVVSAFRKSCGFRWALFAREIPAEFSHGVARGGWQERRPIVDVKLHHSALLNVAEMWELYYPADNVVSLSLTIKPSRRNTLLDPLQHGATRCCETIVLCNRCNCSLQDYTGCTHVCIWVAHNLPACSNIIWTGWNHGLEQKQYQQQAKCL